MGRVPTLLRACAPLAVLLAIAAAGVTTPTHGASAGTVVGATVPSATLLSPSCATGSAATTFGLVLPGANVVTSQDCLLQFGSSNDTSLLHVYQQDRSGNAMFSQQLGAVVGTAQWEVTGGPADETSLVTDIVQDGTGDMLQAGFEDPNELFVLRWTWNGTIDTTWSDGDGSDGYTRVAATRPAESLAMDTWPDGDVLVAVRDPAADGGVRLVRLLADGTPDPDFGTAGSTTIDACDPNGSTNAEYYHDMVVDDDGGAWLAGSCDVAPGTDRQWVVLRLHADGSLDTSFAGDGSWEWNSDAGQLDEAIGIERSGTGVLVGGTSWTGGEQAATLVRLLANGTPDPAFDGDGANVHAGNGIVGYVRAAGEEHLVAGMEVDAAGNVFLAARSSTGTEASRATAVLRLDAGGSPSASFGTAGWSLQDVAAGTADEPTAMLSDGDGSILVTGWIGNAADNEDAYVMRLTPGGQRDSAYDGDGLRTFEFQAGQDNHGVDLDRGLDGQVILTQDADFTPGDGYFVRTKLDAQAIPQYLDVGGGSDRDWSSDPSWTSMFGMCLRELGGTATASAFVEDAGNDCMATDANAWNAVPATPGAAAKAATLGANQTAGTVALRFGFRPAADRAAGSYFAPIAFQVLAPNA